MDKIKFSIIIVCRNAGEKLNKTVSSVTSQTYKDVEIIIKDGMSTDGSVEALPVAQGMKVIRKKDSGIYDAMNQAIGECTGDYVLFLNCGDYLYGEKTLEKTAAWIMTDKNREAIYYGDIYNRQVKSKIASNPSINAFACYRNIPCHQACFYAMTLLRKRGYDLKYKIRADYEHFLWAYFEEKVRPAYMNFTVCSYEGGGYSESPENKKVSAKEHKEIVSLYMGKAQIIWYQFVMALSLAPLRSKIAESKHFSGLYNSLKTKIYGRRGQ